MYNFFRFRNFASAMLIGSTFIGLPDEVQAASKLSLEAGNRGKAKVSLTLEPQPTSATGTVRTGSLVRIVPFPFELSQGYLISNSDDVRVSVLSNGNGYALLAILAPRWDQRINFEIDNAFSLVDDRTRARIKFQLGPSYEYLTTHRAIFSHSETISNYEISISLPKKFEKEELSFEPQGGWTENIKGEEYTLSASTLGRLPSRVFEVWIAFPSLYKEEFNLVTFLLSLIGGIIASIIGNQTLPQQKNQILVVVILLAIAYFGILIFSLFRIPFFELMAPLIGLTISGAWVLFKSSWLLFSSTKQAEVSGRVIKEGGSFPVYLYVFLLVDGRESSKFELEPKDEGRYKFLVWCGKKKKSCKVKVSGSGLPSEVISNDSLVVAAREKKEFADIVIPPSSSSLSQ